MRPETMLSREGFVWIGDQGDLMSYLDTNYARWLEGNTFTDRQEAYRHFIRRLLAELQDSKFFDRVNRLTTRARKSLTRGDVVRILSLYLKESI